MPAKMTPQLRPKPPSRMRVNPMRLAPALMLTVLLPGCGTVVIKTECPALVLYSAAVQTAAATEIEDGVSPTLGRFAVDYGRLRAECRALQR
jgi:hypothetical protein